MLRRRVSIKTSKKGTQGHVLVGRVCPLHYAVAADELDHGTLDRQLST